MSFAIIHMQKLKQPAIKGIQIHNQREKESLTNPDIDDTKLHLNYDMVNPQPIDYHEKVNSMIEEGVTTGKAVRKDAVRVASFLVTSDKEFFENVSEAEEKRFFESAYDFLAEEYGKKNIAYAMVHKDEKTPHMHVGFVPITEDGRLSAKDFFGKKQQLVQLQDKFHKYMVGKGFELERGVSSDRKHIESSRFKAETLKKETEALQQQLKENRELMAKIKKVEVVSLEVPNNPGFHLVKKSDLERLQKLAKAGEEIGSVKSELRKVRQEKENLHLEVKVLNREKNLETIEEKDWKAKNEELKKENETLKAENKSLKQKVKDWMKFNDQSIVAIFKSIVDRNSKDKDFVKELYSNFTSLKEKFFGSEKDKVAQNEKKPLERENERSKGMDYEIGD